MAKTHLKLYLDGHIGYVAASLRTARAHQASHDNPNTEAHGTCFRQERLRLRMSHQQVARRLQTTVRVVKLYEQGAKPGTAQLEGLRGLGFDVAQLLTAGRA